MILVNSSSGQSSRFGWICQRISTMHHSAFGASNLSTATLDIDAWCLYCDSDSQADLDVLRACYAAKSMQLPQH